MRSSRENIPSFSLYGEQGASTRVAGPVHVEDIQLCRRLTGNTGLDLPQQRLALEARRRLIYAADSVSGIANALGFKDSAYFSRFFRRHSGTSPHEFRRLHRGG